MEAGARAPPPPPPPPPLIEQPILPPGFRFHPTDEELVIHYLKNKASSSPLPVPIIAEIDLYKFDPWQLPGWYPLPTPISSSLLLVSQNFQSLMF